MKQTVIRKTLAAFWSVMLMISMALTGYAQCNDRCTLPAKQERGECSIVIDANTGRIVEGSIRISDSCEQVQVYYVNKNPFKYSYTFTSTFVPFDTETALAFLKLIPDFGSTVSSIVEPAAAPGASACTGANHTAADALIVKLQPTAAALKILSDNLRADINTTTQAYATYKNDLTQFFTDTDSDNAFRSDTAGCSNLCGRAKALLVQHAALPDLDVLGKRIESLEAEYTRLEKEAQAFNPTGANASDCRTETVNAIVPKFGPILDGYKAKLAEVKAAKTTLDLRTKIVRAGDSDSFVELVPAQRDDFRGGKLNLTIARKNLRNPDVALDNRTVTLLVGDRNLFISAGIGFSTITDRRIIRQAGLVPDGTGGTKLGTVFGFEENSGFKPSGVIMLNAPLKRFNLFGKKDASIGLGTGLVLSNRNDTVEPEFIVGLSLGLLRDTMFITGGFHAARRENLAPGFRFGQEVPSSLEGALPIEKNFTGGAMFSITYRIK